MSENNIALVSRCMDILCSQVGIVDAERFIYIMRSEAFDYTKWQRDHYDNISPDELNAAVDRFSAEHEFKGSKAKVI
ncbi:MAG: hypothetical protein IK093_14300 [Ruminiclostridium sp.]|nr:hypothetical protein [Ruminiclostridium sp.]